MLLNNLFTYKIVEASDSIISAILSFDGKNEIYSGHFPGRPVTPGVCQIEACKEVLNDVTGGNFHIKSSKDVKFVVPHTPEVHEINLQLNLQKRENGIDVNGSLFKGDIIFMKIRASFE